MAVAEGVPERVAYEPLRGHEMETGDVLDADYEARDCRLVQLLQVQVSDRNTRWFERSEVVPVDPEYMDADLESPLGDDVS